MAYFPLFVELKEKPVLVVGGGAVAARRIQALTEFGCRITVGSLEITDELLKMAERGLISWKREEYRRNVLEEEGRRPVFVLAAAPGAVNAQVVRDCKNAGIPVNDASRKENCDFYFPGLIKDGETVVGVTAGGKDHKFAAALSQVIRTFIKETWKA